MLTSFKTFNFSVEFYKLTKEVKVPSYLRNQLDRASSSVLLNLAEGYGKPSPKEKKRFYSIALGSLRECQSILILANAEKSKAYEKSDTLGAYLYTLVYKK